MSACQDCTLGAEAARLTLETCRWQIVNVITTLTREQQVSPIDLLRADENDGEGGSREGGKEWVSRGERRQRVARESADLEPAAVCPFCQVV